MKRIRVFADVTFSPSKVIAAGSYDVVDKKDPGDGEINAADAEEILKERQPLWGAEIPEEDKPKKPAKKDS